MKPMVYFEHIDFERIILQRIRYAFERIISDEELVYAQQPEVIVERAALGLRLRLVQSIAAQPITHEVTRPATWRDAVKAAFYAWLGTGYDPPGHWPWFGDYCRRRWPVRERVDIIDAAVLYPKIAIPEQQHQVVFVRARYQ